MDLDHCSHIFSMHACGNQNQSNCLVILSINTQLKSTVLDDYINTIIMQFQVSTNNFNELKSSWCTFHLSENRPPLQNIRSRHKLP